MTIRAESDTQGQSLCEDLQVWHAFLLRKASQKVTGVAEVMLAPLGITLRQFGILSVIGAEPGLNQRAVGGKLRIDRTTIVSLIDELERTGLVERRRGSDRRTFALYLTGQGHALAQQAQSRLAQVHDVFLRPLSEEERATLRALLLRLVVDDGAAGVESA